MSRERFLCFIFLLIILNLCQNDKKMTLEFYFQVLFCKFARIRKNNFSIPLLQMLRFSRRVKYYDTVYRRICYGFLDENKRDV